MEEGVGGRGLGEEDQFNRIDVGDDDGLHGISQGVSVYVCECVCLG